VTPRNSDQLSLRTHREKVQSRSAILSKSGWQQGRGYLDRLWSREGMALPHARVAQEMLRRLSIPPIEAHKFRRACELRASAQPLAGMRGMERTLSPVVSRSTACCILHTKCPFSFPAAAQSQIVYSEMRRATFFDFEWSCCLTHSCC
jgi:hypothetical protein